VRAYGPTGTETSEKRTTAQGHITSDDVLNDAQDFSLVLGGPLYQLVRRAHLSDDALMMVRRRAIVIVLLGWLPLLVLSAVQGDLWGKHVAVPFVLDMEVHIRFLIVVPLLVIAELVVHQRLRPIVRAFLERNLIPEDDLTPFDKAITSALRLRNSVVAEVLVGTADIQSLADLANSFEVVRSMRLVLVNKDAILQL